MMQVDAVGTAHRVRGGGCTEVGAMLAGRCAFGLVRRVSVPGGGAVTVDTYL